MTTNSSIETRRQIWLALSELYLDTELTDDDLYRIAKIFHQSGLTINRIKEIDIYEVFPVLQPNLLSVAGSWAGFDSEWLFKECESMYIKRQSWFHNNITKFWNRIFYRMRLNYWNKIEKYYHKFS